MPGYSVRRQRVHVGRLTFELRVLNDLQQFADPDHHGARLGISDAQWSLFGQVWPAGELLARAMKAFPIAGKRILELGCGIGLPSLVLQRRGARIVASDIHPLADSFLAYNAALNDLPALHFRQLDWSKPLPTLGRFDVIIASDVLYEPGHAQALAHVIDRHAHANAEVVLTDAGRGHRGAFQRMLRERDFRTHRGGPTARTVLAGQPRHRILHMRRATGEPADHASLPGHESAQPNHPTGAPRVG
jgi:predicted nicotinamide N-methyase